MALTRAKKEQRIRIRKLIANYLETCTAWGKYFARPSQIVDERLA